MASYAQLKEEESAPQITGDDKARARLGSHLSYRGFYVSESDALGPVEVVVRGGDCLETWRRDSKAKGDWTFVYVSRQMLKYQWP